MDFEAVAFWLGELAGVTPKGGKWDTMESIVNNQTDKRMKAALRRVDKLVRDKHWNAFNQQYPGYKSTSGKYPARRTGDLQGSLHSVMEFPKKGVRRLRFEYMPDIATHSEFYYPKKLFAESGKGGGRKSVEHLMYEMIDEIHDILQVSFDITPLEEAF